MTTGDRNLPPGRLRGRCLCGDVSFTLEGPAREVVQCYCSECRRSSGNFVAATAVELGHLRLEQAQRLSWYVNAHARRGFCSACGSSLFWLPEPEDGVIRVMAGCLETPTGLRVAAQVFVDDRSDFQEICGSVPCYSDGRHDISIPGRNLVDS